ncbi:hypothetical protein Syun_021155 [Stephania yunnanensis]|uniref:Uncharacterized protein n=1 Tax=Stephania yunnanensis TaxID=152371 RepID=A0AAP0IFA0_9MAGN
MKVVVKNLSITTMKALIIVGGFQRCSRPLNLSVLKLLIDFASENWLVSFKDQAIVFDELPYLDRMPPQHCLSFGQCMNT